MFRSTYDAQQLYINEFVWKCQRTCWTITTCSIYIYLVGSSRRVTLHILLRTWCGYCWWIPTSTQTQSRLDAFANSLSTFELHQLCDSCVTIYVNNGFVNTHTYIYKHTALISFRWAVNVVRAVCVVELLFCICEFVCEYALVFTSSIVLYCGSPKHRNRYNIYIYKYVFTKYLPESQVGFTHSILQKY